MNLGCFSSKAHVQIQFMAIKRRLTHSPAFFFNVQNTKQDKIQYFCLIADLFKHLEHLREKPLAKVLILILKLTLEKLIT